MQKSTLFVWRAAQTTLVSLMLLAVVACNKLEPVGADRDQHGCIGSAGYQWCNRQQECVRPWELAQRNGMNDSQLAMQQLCE